MRPASLALLAVAGLLALAPAAAAEEDPFAEDDDPFDGEDPFAEYESQVDETVDATGSLTEDGGEDRSGNESEDADVDDGDQASDEQTKDSPGLGLGLVAVAGLAGALLATREP